MSGYEPEEFEYESEEGFDPDGFEDVQPLGPVSLAALQVELEQEAEQQLDPSYYPALEGLSPEAEATQWGAQVEAQQQLARSDYEQELHGRVSEAAREFELGPQAVQDAAVLVDEVRRAVFGEALGRGFDVAQAVAAADEVEPAAVRQALEQQRYLKVTAGTSLVQWRQGREAAARTAAREGRPPPSDEHVFGPAWRRLNRVTAAHAERQRQRDAVWRQHFKNQGGR